MSGHQRAQVLYYIGENLAARQAAFAARLRTMTGASAAASAGKSTERGFQQTPKMSALL